MSTGTPEDEELMQRISAALEARENGEDVDIERLCDGRDDWIRAVRSALDLAAGLEASITRATPAEDPDVERYRTLELVGAGSMGIVHRARDTVLRRDVAIKTLHVGLKEAGEATRRFAQEASSLAAVSHPSVVEVYDVDRDRDGGRRIVMQFVDGIAMSDLIATAKQRLSDGGFAAVERTDWLRELLPDAVDLETSYTRCCARWGLQLAEGLRAAHAASVLHRDVKPSNVRIDRGGRAVLVDFGIAVLLDGDALTVRPGSIGTPAFMAPELLDRNPQRKSAAIDVYSLGATLYQLATLRPPYEGSLESVLEQLRTVDPKPTLSVRDDLPRDFAAVLDQCLERQPQRRPASAAALADELGAFLDHRPVRARPRTMLAWLARRAARSPLVRVAALSVVLATLAVAWLTWSARERERAEAATWDGLARLSPTMSISATPRYRVIQDAAERQRTSASLDALVAGAPDPLPASMLRGVFRFDHGDRAGAAADFRALARHHGGPFLEALAARYHEAVDDGAEVTLAGLPEPAADAARVVWCYHRVRELAADDEGGTRALVERIATIPLERRPWIHGLRLVLLTDIAALVAPDSDERVTRHRETHEGALRLEGVLGRSTSTTSYARATAMAGLGRAAESADAWRQLVALRPDEYGYRTNYAAVLRQLERFDAARAQIDHAIALRPDALLAHETGVHVEITAAAFEAASRRLSAVPYRDDAVGRARRTMWAMRIELTRALEAWRAGDQEFAARAAEQAADLLRELPPDALRFERAACNLLLHRASGADESIGDRSVGDLLTWLAERPTSVRRLRNTALLLPDHLDPSDTDGFRHLLRTLANSLLQSR